MDSTVLNGDLEFDRENMWGRGTRMPAGYELKAIHILRSFMFATYPTYLIRLLSLIC
jgi:hypothetical protein